LHGHAGQYGQWWIRPSVHHSKGNALRPPTYNEVRSARDIDNFFWGLEAYFEAAGIDDEAKKGKQYFLLT